MIEVIFDGRRLGSLGDTYKIKEWVANDPRLDESACQEELSKNYENISEIVVAEARYTLFMV